VGVALGRRILVTDIGVGLGYGRGWHLWLAVCTLIIFTIVIFLLRAGISARNFPCINYDRLATLLHSRQHDHVCHVLHSRLIMSSMRSRRQQWYGYVNGWRNGTCQREHAPVPSFYPRR
jgi:hypothetical protein